jgi:hypothetical protein
MSYHHSNFRKFALVLFLGGCFFWAKRDLLLNSWSSRFTNTDAMVEFGPLPMIPDLPEIPDFPQEEELFLPQPQELMEQQLELQEKLLKEWQEKTDRIKID